MEVPPTSFGTIFNPWRWIYYSYFLFWDVTFRYSMQLVLLLSRTSSMLELALHTNIYIISQYLKMYFIVVNGKKIPKIKSIKKTHFLKK